MSLERSELQYRLIVDTALDAVLTMDERGRITDWNAQAETMFGWTRAEALGRQMADTVIPPRYREAHQVGLRKFLTTGEGPVLNRRIEITAVRRSGEEFPVELAISPARQGGEWTFSAFIRDLTERNRAAEAVRRGEQRYRDLFQDMPIGVYRSTPDGRLVDVNPAMVSMLGYPDRESLLATPATALYVDPAERRKWSEEMAREGFVRNFVVPLRRADGSVIWTRDTTHARRDAGGALSEFEGVLEDITEVVEAERRLQANERRLAQILETVPIGIFVTGFDGSAEFANAAATRIFGRGILPGTSASEYPDIYQVYHASTGEMYAPDELPLVRALQGERVATEDIEVRPPGGVVSLSVQAAPIVDDSGAVVAAVAAFMDTSERKLLEAQLRQALKMEAVGQLAGGVAHDFNNLLTVILSCGSMLLDRLTENDPNHQDVQEMTTAAERAAVLTRQLLAFSRKQVLQPKVIDLHSVIMRVENMLRRLIGEHIELHLSLHADMPRINADPGQLEQVLVNLAVNARDAMPGGGQLHIATANVSVTPTSHARSPQLAPGDYLVLSVRDTGTGMTEEVRQRLFDPFFTTKELGQGTGLGLSTVYGIVKQSGGEIVVVSEAGRGATFDLYFPAVADGLEEPGAGANNGDVPCGSETVLVVEDDASLRALAARVLRRYGYRVLAAGGGEEALTIASDDQTRIDLVLTDVVMPDLNGREVVEKLLELRPGLAYLFMSGYTDDEILRRGVLQGDTAFLPKPFTPDQLARKIREVLDKAAT